MIASLLDSYDKSLNKHSGDEETPSPLNISHSFEYFNDRVEVQAENEIKSRVSVLSFHEEEESINVSSSSSIFSQVALEDPN